MQYVDIGIPANNKGKYSIGCLFWLLARMVLQMRNTIAPAHNWDVMQSIYLNEVDLFFYRDPEEAKEQQEEAEAPVAPDYGAAADYGSAVPVEQWASEFVPAILDGSAIHPMVSPAAGAEWTPQVATDAWDAAAAPAPEAGLPVDNVAVTGWDAAAVPGPTGCE